MYAIILDRNKQYLIKDNLSFKVDFLNIETGKIIKIDKILFLNENNETTVGKPFIKNKIILLEVLKHIKDDKKIILKFKRRKHHIKKIGHRQKYTLLKIIGIKNIN
ncbi:MAG TPA: 50S ribosomal protein L21 [Candidatus Azoamicus sp. OHIO2]